jgi:hypothetical protein
VTSHPGGDTYCHRLGYEPAVVPLRRQAGQPRYRRAKASGVGRIRGGGVGRDVRFGGAAPDAHAGIDDAHHAKYDRYGPQITSGERAGGRAGDRLGRGYATRTRFHREAAAGPDPPSATPLGRWPVHRRHRLVPAAGGQTQRRPGPGRRGPHLGVDHTEVVAADPVGAGRCGRARARAVPEGERAPDRPDATGALHGLTPSTAEPASLARAAVEGLLCGLADGLDAIRATGVAIRRFLLVRGGARSEASTHLNSGRAAAAPLAYRRTDRRPRSRPVDEARDGRCR